MSKPSSIGGEKVIDEPPSPFAAKIRGKFSKRLTSGLAAVVFDAVGTLIHPEPSAAEIYAEVGRRHGSRLGVAEVAARFQAAFLAEEVLDREQYAFRTSEERERKRWQNIVRAVLSDAADCDTCFEELYSHFAKPTAWNCPPEAVQIVERFLQGSWTVGIASNYDSRLLSVVAGTPVLRRLDPIVISSEVGWRKPAGEFFVLLCQRLGLPVQRVLYVGDDLAND